MWFKKIKAYWINIYNKNEINKGENVNEENIGYYLGFFIIIWMRKK